MAILDTIGNLLGTSNKGTINKAVASLDDILTRSGTTSAQNKALLENYLAQMKNTYGAGSEAYGDAVKAVADAIGGYGEYDKSVNDFLDPFREQAAQQATDTITSSAANAGNLFSSSYLDKVAAKQRALSTESWKAAYDAYQKDRAQALQEQQQKVNNAGTLANLYGADRTALANALGEYTSGIMGQNQADLQTYSDVVSNKANLQAQKSNGVMDAVGGIAKIIGSFF